MADLPDDDALFDRLAKSLEAVRHDAELARTGGVAGVSVSLTRAETELHRITTEVADLRRRVDAQERSMAAGGSAGAQSAAELRSLREAVESLSRRVEAHEARLSARERSRSWPAGRIALVIAVIIVILGGAAAWAGFGLRPTPRELADRFVSRVAELTGFQSVVRRAPAAASPAPVQASEASVPTGPAPAASAVSPGPALLGDSVASNPAPASSTPAPAPTAAAGPAPAPSVTATQAVAPPAGVTAAPVAAPSAAGPASASSASATQAVAPPAGVTGAPVAAPSAAKTETASAAPTSPAPASATPATVGSPTPLASQTIDAATQAPAAMSQAQPPHQVLLRATADSWVEIRQKGGRTLLRRILRPGETWPIPADPTLVLSSGNAGVLELVVDGVATRLAPGKGGMIHDMPLDPQSIAADVRPHP